MPALWGPTAGYLLGFVPAAWIAGLLAERSWTQNVARAFIAALLASLPILIIGTIVLAGFVGWNNVLEMGLYPFLAGDVIKCGAAAVSVAVLNKHKG
jgi:biotin transport system substrate-specific component